MSRRDAIKLTAATAAAGVATLALPATASAGFLHGTWYVACKKCGNCDKVENQTANHPCETKDCGYQSVKDGTAWVVCPDGHWKLNKVEGITKQHKCDNEGCGKQCEGQKVKPKPEPK